MSDRRIVVTGMGAVSALGATVAETWRRARDGEGGIALHTLDTGDLGPPAQTFPIARVAAGHDAAAKEALGARAVGGLDPFASYALCAAFEAVAAAGLLNSGVLDTRTAVVVGHGLGGLGTLEAGYQKFYGQRHPRPHPATVPRVMVSGGASAIAMALGIHGVVFATSSACSSSAHAIVQGASLIHSGLADVAIVGGSEAIATPACMAAWASIQALSPTTCRPFSKERDGMVMGEGAGALVLETAEHAAARGATPIAELLGAGMTSDAHHITQPSLDGPVAAMRQACGAAGLLDDPSVLIAAHGTGTALNDVNEARAIRTVFGANADNHPVIATNSAHGHLIGGSAALQAVIGIMALRDGLAPPVLNFGSADPDCDIDLVLGKARPIDARGLLVNAFAFGGLNVSLAFLRL